MTGWPGGASKRYFRAVVNPSGAGRAVRREFDDAVKFTRFDPINGQRSRHDGGLDPVVEDVDIGGIGIRRV